MTFCKLRWSLLLVFLLIWAAVSGQNATEETSLNEKETEDGAKPKLTGIPQIDYIHDPNLPHEIKGYDLSNYPFYKRLPKDLEKSNFSCVGRHDGFYASIPHKCQVYHNCLFEVRYDFLCANYTAFDQKNFICHFVSEVDCENSEKYYSRNEALYETTTTTTEAPRVIYVDRQKPFRRLPTRLGSTGNRPPQRPQKYPYYDDYYYYGGDYYDYPEAPASAQPTTTTTTNRPRRRRPSGETVHLQEQELGSRNNVPPRPKFPPRLGEAPRTQPQEFVEEDYPVRVRPFRGPGNRRRPGFRRPNLRKSTTTTTTTTTSTASPKSQDLYDYYYDYYYDDTYEQTTTSTTTPKPKRTRVRPGVNRHNQKHTDDAVQKAEVVEEAPVNARGGGNLSPNLATVEETEPEAPFTPQKNRLTISRPFQSLNRESLFSTPVEELEDINVEPVVGDPPIRRNRPQFPVRRLSNSRQTQQSAPDLPVIIEDNVPLADGVQLDFDSPIDESIAEADSPGLIPQHVRLKHRLRNTNRPSRISEY